VGYIIFMNQKELLEESDAIRDEATEVLSLTQIEKELAKYGEVNLIGSYKYRVMLDRDIDFHIIIDRFSPVLAKRFFDFAADSKLFEYVSFHDKHTFNKEAAARYAAKIALDSYYFGLRMQHKGNEWQIGVNFITKPQEASVEIVNLFNNVSDEQRAQILEFKKLIRAMKIPMSSSYIYRAVIQEKITKPEALLRYLETIGYTF
jgi:hypothetical protein